MNITGAVTVEGVASESIFFFFFFFTNSLKGNLEQRFGRLLEIAVTNP